MAVARVCTSKHSGRQEEKRGTKVCYDIELGGRGGRVTFELLLITGWRSQVSGSKQDLLTRLQR